LFGHERGSFTGALALRQGWFERAHNGTLFLDECGELSLPAQVRLLRVLQDGSLQRVGGERQIHVDVRVIAATHRDLESMVAEGRFREDLWYRLAVFPVRLPPLRERTDDIPALAAHFARAAAKRFGLPACQVMEEDLALLQAYDWPGNVRELISVIERAALLGEGKCLAVAAALGAAQPRLRSRVRTVPAEEEDKSGFSTLDQAMARHIEAALERSRGRIEGTRGAAELLGINPHTLRARMRRLEIDWQRFRGPAA
jgi:transcriptional regulator with GAF, ATPase, and Fis domain